MGKFKKIASLMLAMVMAVTALCALSVNAGAASVFSGAKNLKQLDTVSWTAKTGTQADQKYYKITVPSAGTITLRYADIHWTFVRLYDAKAKDLGGTEGDFWSKNTIDVPQKGTYYIKLFRSTYEFQKNDTTYVKGFYWTFEPKPTPKVTISETLNVGDKISLAASVEDFDDTVKWTVSNKKVAKIENGKLVAVGEGKCTVTASVDYETIIDEIKIVVKKTKVPAVTITMGAKVGSTLDLSAAVSNSSSKVTWGTTDQKVATVTDGKVKFVGAGSVIIQAALSDGTYTRIKFNVTK